MPMSKHAVLLHVPGDLYQMIHADSTGKPWPNNCSVTSWLLDAERKKLEALAAPVVGPSTVETGSSLEAHSSMVVKSGASEYFRLKREFEAATTEEDRDRLLAALLEIKPEAEGRLRMWRKNKPLVEFV